MTVTDLDAPPESAAVSTPADGAVVGADRPPMESIAGTADHKSIGRLMIGASLGHLVIFLVFERSGTRTSPLTGTSCPRACRTGSS